MYIGKVKKDHIRRLYIKGDVNAEYLSTALELYPATVRFYLNQLDAIKEQYPDRLSDYSFYIGKQKPIKEHPWYTNVMRIIPELVAKEIGPKIVCLQLYRKYKVLCPNEYSSVRFCVYFRKWFRENDERINEEKLLKKYTEEELTTLRKWRRGNDRRLWQVAVLLMTTYTYHSLTDLSKRIECDRVTMRKWLTLYNQHGLAALSRPGSKCPISEEKKKVIEAKMDDLIHLVRQSPKLFGVDSTSWTIVELARVYAKQSGKYIAQSTVSVYLKARGVRFKRSREMITSSDAKFNVKYEAIQQILANLGDKEKFFSIDEYGPRAVRPRGGRILSVKGEIPVYQKVEKSKGWFICTSALELSTNQLTWFYSKHKDTTEMIKLIEMLLERYNDQEKLYLSWDAASWHSSAQLIKYLEKINDKAYRLEKGFPEVVLAPLPSKAPHLNVIESVFSGLSKSVIHNSSYGSLDECKTAINKYFNKRNQYYRDNPKKAGKKIWGKEKVIPVFDKANICRNL
jgi:transposase